MVDDKAWARAVRGCAIQHPTRLAWKRHSRNSFQRASMRARHGFNSLDNLNNIDSLAIAASLASPP